MSILPTIQSTGSLDKTEPRPKSFSFESIAPRLERKSIDELMKSMDGACL